MACTQPAGFLHHSPGGNSLGPILFKPQYTLKLVTGPIVILYSLYCSAHSFLQSVSIIYRIHFVLFFFTCRTIASDFWFQRFLLGAKIFPAPSHHFNNSPLSDRGKKMSELSALQNCQLAFPLLCTLCVYLYISI